ncbi:MAG: SnoaL-like domain-containing protein [Planctomycetota bacterium]|nr:SnoaL-like domain-containing protein [Planctomycetota bacterium]
MPKDKKSKKDKKALKKAHKKASPPKVKPGKKKDKLAPTPVTTGKGASPVEIGADFVAMFNRGEWQQIEDKYYDKKLVSIEGLGVNLAWHGRKAVRAKSEAWMADHQIHGASAEGPFVGSTGFAVRFKMDVENKAAGTREIMDEVAVYTVLKGKVVREEFMYFAPGAPAKG